MLYLITLPLAEMTFRTLIIFLVGIIAIGLIVGAYWKWGWGPDWFKYLVAAVAAGGILWMILEYVGVI